MASFDMDKKGGSAIIRFRYLGIAHKRSLRITPDEASRVCEIIKETIRKVKAGLLVIPSDANLPWFLISGGQTASVPIDLRPAEVKLTFTCESCRSKAKKRDARPTGSGTQRRQRSFLSLSAAYQKYRRSLTEGAKEHNTLRMESIHWRHLCRILGDEKPFGAIGLEDVQRYVNARVTEGVVRVTIRKELCTLGHVANWARRRKLITDTKTWSWADLSLPKGKQTPPFQTWRQIERQIARSSMTPEQQAELWECLWLTQDQVQEFLDWSREHTGNLWFHPVVAIAAYTGARRSEILRSEIDDWDLDADRLMIRQKKADTDLVYSRRLVSIHSHLKPIIAAWIARNPQGPKLIVNHGNKPVTVSQAAHGFRLAVKGSKWEVLRGYHVLRHSFASNLAAQGTDQRIIDRIMGHSTDEMSRRYRHLGPDQMRGEIESLFGGAR